MGMNLFHLPKSYIGEINFSSLSSLFAPCLHHLISRLSTFSSHNHPLSLSLFWGGLRDGDKFVVFYLYICLAKKIFFFFPENENFGDLFFANLEENDGVLCCTSRPLAMPSHLFFSSSLYVQCSNN